MKKCNNKLKRSVLIFVTIILVLSLSQLVFASQGYVQVLTSDFLPQHGSHFSYQGTANFHGFCNDGGSGVRAQIHEVSSNNKVGPELYISSGQKGSVKVYLDGNYWIEIWQENLLNRSAGGVGID